MFSLLIVSFAVITLVFDAQTAPLIDSDRLPGLDEIESGSDVVGLFSESDKKSKFRIFDLSEESLYPFKINAGGDERVYKTPRDAQVTKIGLRREVNCEDLSNGFDQFYSNYFRSNQISGGGPFFFFRIVNSYPETLKKIYESMTKEAKSVGTSTSWWGLYSIQLAPPFILKLDPSFNSSVTALVSLPIPTTDDQQVLYNILLETYGTHYVTHVIVGSTAHVYTFVNQTLYNSSTFEEMFTQVGNTGSSWFSQTNSLNQGASDSFRKNSNSFAVYQPPVIQIVEGKTEYQTWLAYASQEPVVVNRTLAPLSNLFYRYPQVQAHLRRTIDYYLAKGNFPTFTQLQF